MHGIFAQGFRKQGIHLPTMGHARKLEDLRKIASEVNTFSEKAEDSLKSGNNEEAGSMYNAVEKLQIKLCYPLSLNLMRTRDSLLKVFMELNNWKDNIPYYLYDSTFPPPQMVGLVISSFSGIVLQRLTLVVILCLGCNIIHVESLNGYLVKLQIVLDH